MIRLTALALVLVTSLFTSCSGGLKLQPLLSKVLVMSYSEFGTESLASPLLGAGGAGTQVVVHYGLPESFLSAKYPGPQYRFVAVAPAIKHLNRTVTQVPHDAANAELRARLIATRSRLMNYYNTRRVAFNSVPPFVGRSFMVRQAMMPPLGTTR